MSIKIKKVAVRTWHILYGNPRALGKLGGIFFKAVKSQ